MEGPTFVVIFATMYRPDWRSNLNPADGITGKPDESQQTQRFVFFRTAFVRLLSKRCDR